MRCAYAITFLLFLSCVWSCGEISGGATPDGARADSGRGGGSTDGGGEVVPPMDGGGEVVPPMDGGEEVPEPLDAAARDAGRTELADAGFADAGFADAGFADAGRTDAGAGSLQTGASLASCPSARCASGSVPRFTGCVTTGDHPADHVVGLGNIDAGGGVVECRFYGYYRPADLTGRPAAILIGNGSGGGIWGAANMLVPEQWDQVAMENRVVMLPLARPTSAERPTDSWFHPNIDIPDPGPSAPSDLPYVRAVVRDAITRFGLDPERIYYFGYSSGGALGASIMCDPTTSAVFRGAAKGGHAFALDTSATPGSERCAALHPGTFLYVSAGTFDAAYTGRCPLPTGTHCASSFAETMRLLFSMLGCSAPPTSTSFGTGGANTHLLYHDCGFGTPEDDLLGTVIGGVGHGGTIGANGYYPSRDVWDFFSTRAWR